MADFNKAAFESLMGEAVQRHREQDYEEALALSRRAYDLAPADTFEKGRAARDTAARYDRLGSADAAEHWASVAYGLHDELLTGMETPTREAYRERSVSAMYVGVVGLRRYLSASGQNESVHGMSTTLATMRQGWEDIQAAKLQAGGLNRLVDQYEINASRRVSLAESLLGDAKTGLALGMRAVALASWSESPKLDTADVNIAPRERFRMKLRVFAGGLAAVGVGILALPRIESLEQKAHHLARKVL